MSKSTKTKPRKPPGCPLFPHASGRWCKKRKGRFHYFGPWDDLQGALERYNREWSFILEGREPPDNDLPDGLTIADLCNRYLSSKKRKLDSNELCQGSWVNYFTVCEKIVAHFGKKRAVEFLTPEDFGEFRASLAKGKALYSVLNDVRDSRSVFRYAVDNHLVKHVRMGTEFQIPTRTHLDVERQKKQERHGLRMFEAAEIHRILEAGTPNLCGMTMLEINCGFGNTDVASLPISAVDLEKGWIDFPRPKTAIPRRCPLWPETVDALRKVIGDRTEDLVFRTRTGGSYVRYSVKWKCDNVGVIFGKLLRNLEMKRLGLGFYALRHTFQTIAENQSRDVVAVMMLMGHRDSSMSSRYREYVDDERLKDVTDMAHDWLFPPKKKRKKSAAKKTDAAR